MPSLTRSGLLVAGLTVGGLLVGLGRGVLVAHHFGSAAAYNAFVVAQTIPWLVVNIFLGGAVAGAFVPGFVGRLHQQGEDEAWRYATTVGVAVLGGGLLAGAAVALGAATIVEGVGPGLPPDVRAAAIHMTVLLAASVPVLTAAAFGAAVLNAHEEFAAPGMRALVNGLPTVTLLLVAAPLGIDALLMGFVAGMGLQVAVLLPSLWHRARGHLRFAPRADDLRDLGGRYLPVFLTHALLQTFLLLDRSFSTLANPAGAAQFEYAERVVNASRAVLGGSLAIVLFPRLTHLKAMGDAAEALIARALGLVCVVTLPVVMTLVFFGDVPVALAFEHGRFDVHDARAVTAALRGLGPAVLFYGLLYVADRIFIARGRVWTYAGIVALGLVADAVVKVRTVERLGLLGVGLGTAVGTLIIAVVASAVLVAGGAPGTLRPAWRDLWSAVLAFGVCFGGAALAAAFFELGAWGRLGALGVGWVFGLGLLSYLRPPAWVMLWGKVRGFF